MFPDAPAGSTAARWRGVIAGLLFALLTAGAWGALGRALTNAWGIWAAWLPFSTLLLGWGFLIWNHRRQAR